MARRMSTKQRTAALKNLKKARAARRKGRSSHKTKAHRKSHKKARKSAKRRRHLKASGRIRPVVIVSGGKYHRPKKSKYFRGPTRINKRRRHARRNPGGLTGSVKSIFKVATLKRVLSVGGGILAGTFVSRFLSTGIVPGMATPVLPASVTTVLAKARPVHGLFHLLVGFYLQKQRNPIVKDMGMGVAALGGFDLLTQVLSLAGVKNLPTFAGMNVTLMGMNVNTAARPIVLQGNYANEPSMSDDLVGL